MEYIYSKKSFHTTTMLGHRDTDRQIDDAPCMMCVVAVFFSLAHSS
jgi:hypothetical protein